MKETKVYVDVEPRKIATQLVDLENEQFNCVILMFDTDVKPIEVIVEPKFKDHDRELVKEVCEKIRKWGNKHFNYVGDGTGYDGQDYNEMIGFNNAIKKLNEFLYQIQKEYEK